MEKQGGANTSTGLKDIFYSREEAEAAAQGRNAWVLWGQRWAGDVLVSVWHVVDRD